MARNQACKIYIGNLDDKVTERVLYEILIQVGRVVDLYIPRDKETNRMKGFAFAEYETEEIAVYAVKLFSGLIRLYNKPLRFALAGQDKSSENTGAPITPKLHSSLPKPYPAGNQSTEVSHASTPSNFSFRSPAVGTPLRFAMSGQDKAFQSNGNPLTPKLNSPYYSQCNEYTEVPHGSVHSNPNFRVPPLGTLSHSPIYSQASTDGLVRNSNFENRRHGVGAMLNNVSRPGARSPVSYPSY